MADSLVLVSKDIESRIFSLRGAQIILDRDLAMMYGVETRVLKQAINRNIIRFPSHFMFEVSENEINNMVSQSVIPSKSYFGGSKPYAFTEQGVACMTHRTRLQNMLRAPGIDPIEKALLKQRLANLTILQGGYMEKQKKVMGELGCVCYAPQSKDQFLR